MSCPTGSGSDAFERFQPSGPDHLDVVPAVALVLVGVGQRHVNGTRSRPARHWPAASQGSDEQPAAGPPPIPQVLIAPAAQA